MSSPRSLSHFRASHAEDLYARLKQLPKVATVSIKQSALTSFTETTAKFILVFSGILTRLRCRYCGGGGLQ